MPSVPVPIVLLDITDWGGAAETEQMDRIGRRDQLSPILQYP
jgi:hypothetical protein